MNQDFCLLLNLFLVLSHLINFSSCSIISSRISIYTYPAADSDPNTFYQNLIKEVEIPQRIIFKIMDVDTAGKLYPKVSIANAMMSSFPHSSFTYEWLINIANEAILTTQSATTILNQIKTMKTQLSASPVSITIDAEPIIDPAVSSYNTMAFHTELIKNINSQLGLPASFYINPSIFANPDLNVKNRTYFNDLMNAMKINSGNYVYLAAYSGVRVDRVQQSIAILKAAGVKYKIIVDISNLQFLATILTLLKTNGYSSDGVVIYRLDQSIPKLPTGTMELIMKYY